MLCGGNRGLVHVRSKAIKYWLSRGQMTELVGGDGLLSFSFVSVYMCVCVCIYIFFFLLVSFFKRALQMFKHQWIREE